MPIIQLALLVIGFILLTVSAQEAIKRLIRIARALHISEFGISFVLAGVIAITPEFSIALNSALSGVPAFGLGIVFGSNIADLTLILGIVALLNNGIRFQNGILRHIPWFIASVFLPVFLLIDGEISFFDGLFLIGAFIAYVIHMLRMGSSVKQKQKNGKINLFMQAAVFALCFAFVLVAGHLIANATESLSIAIGMPLFLLGIVLAIGTCLPELTIALQASRNHHTQLGIGNILGNVFADSMLTVGIVALVSPIRPVVPVQAFTAGFFMVLSLFIVLYLFKKKKSMSRTEGAFLICLYVLFLAIESFAF